MGAFLVGVGLLAVKVAYDVLGGFIAYLMLETVIKWRRNRERLGEEPDKR